MPSPDPATQPIDSGGPEPTLPARQPDRRRHDRRPAGGLPGRIGFSQSLRVLDLDLHGARVATSEALSPGRRYHFQLGGLHLTAAVVRCMLVCLESEDEGSRPLFEAGLAFDPLLAVSRRQLGQVLATLDRPGRAEPPALTNRAGAAAAAG